MTDSGPAVRGATPLIALNDYEIEKLRLVRDVAHRKKRA